MNTTGIYDLWIYLSAEPLLSLTLTLGAYMIGVGLFRLSKYNPIINPVLIAIILIVAVLEVTGTSYKTYFQGAQFIHFLLGPATVALAIPLHRQIDTIRRSGPAILVSLAIGSSLAILAAIAVAYLLGADSEIVASVAPKSITTPVAMGISAEIHGLPSLTAVIVLVTGVLGSVFGPMVLNFARIKNPAARGFAMGLAAHGLGTARALMESEVCGAFSGLGMGLNALVAAILLPIIWHFFG